MGQDYSYTQPSSSECDMIHILEEEAALYADEVDSRYAIAEAFEYPPQPEADEGIPRTCYCGAEPFVDTSYTRKDPGRRYYTCVNADDGDCHIWKWWDVAVMEDMRESQTQLRMLKDQFFERDQKVVKLEKILGLLIKKKSEAKYGFAKGVCVLVMVIAVMVMGWKSFRGCKPQWLNSKFGWQSIINHHLNMNNRDGFVNLLHSQSSVDLESPEPVWFDSQGPDEYCFQPGVSVQAGVESAGKERRKWSPTEDKILIGAWLNTSKDAVVSNDQKADCFWKRIVDYYNASPQLVETIPREIGPCKQRWARINEQVCKFVGCYDAALRGQRNGQNDDDVMKAALESFFSMYGTKFGLEHAWRELRHDQKWCSTYIAKDIGKDKRKQVVDLDGDDEVPEPEGRPVGVKGAKAAGKRKKSGREEEMDKLQDIMEKKEKLYNQKILDRLLAKKVHLSEMEESLKLKLMSEMI